MPTFPTEIFEHIIGFVWPDRRTLIACALTCRAWLPRSRRDLLSCIDLKSAKELHLFSRLITDHPGLQERIRELNIAPDQADVKLLCTFPFMLARKLKRVEHLRIYRPRGLTVFHPIFLMTLSDFTSISRLEITMTVFPSLTMFGRMVSALPSLSTLICASIKWTKGEFNPLHFAYSGPRLKLSCVSLSFVAWSAEFVDWLLATTSLAGLHTVNLRRIRMKDMAHVTRLLQAVGLPLHHLVIGVESVDGEQETYPDFSHHPCLQSLLLDFRTRGDWIPELLSKAKASSLRQVTISSQAKFGKRELDRLRCDRIDELLASPKRSNVTQVICEYHPRMDTGWSNWLRQEVPQRFPRLSGRGLVRVKCAHRLWWEL